MTIIELQSIASHKGGKCLSTEYINDNSPLTWMCAKGHTWDAPIFIINQGGWCNQCVKDGEAEEIRKEKLEKIKALAIIKGGLCLSETYKDTHTKINFQCANGHQFSHTMEHIRVGLWCKTCNRKAVVERIFSAIKINTEKHGGKCLTANYISSEVKMQWECKEGHHWNATAKSINAGQWCPVCFHKKLKQINTRHTITELQQHAEKLGGKVLSETYNYGENVKWQCSKGHTWGAAASAVINDHTWCRVCSIENRKFTVKTFQQIAESRGGKLLSENYLNINSKLKFQCAKGHTWEAVPTNVKKGSWCIKCFRESRKLTIEEFQEIAKKHNGKLLTEEYIKNSMKLKFECSKGHVWEAKAQNIKLGSWCRICFYEGRKILR